MGAAGRAILSLAALGLPWAAGDALAAGDGGVTTITKKKKPFEIRAWAGVAKGKSSYYRAREWVPVTVEITNNTKTDKRKNTKGITYKGEMHVSSSYSFASIASRNNYVTRHTIAFESPEQSVKRYTIGIWLLGSEMSLNVTLYDRGRLMGHAAVPVMRMPGDSPLVVLVQGRNSPKRFWRTLTLQRQIPGGMTPGGSVRWRPYVHACLPGTLPRDAEHLAFADAIIVLGAPEGIMEAELLDALLNYARCGGGLVIASGPDFERYAAANVAERFGAFASSPRILTLSSLPGLARDLRAKRPPRLAKGVRVPKLAALPGTEVISAEHVKVSQVESDESISPLPEKQRNSVAVPTILRSTCCAGQVTTVALDLESEFIGKWDSRNALINKGLLGRSSRPVLGRVSDGTIPVGDVDYLRKKVGKILDEASVVKHPPRQWVIAFLAVYVIIIVPLFYVLFNAFGRREIAWMLTPVASVAFGVYAYGVGFWGKEGSLSVTQISVVETSSENRLGRTTSYSAIYSPVRATYDLDLGPGTLVNHLPVLSEKRGGGDFELNVDHPGTTTVRGLYIKPRSMRFLETRSLSDIGGQITGAIDGTAARLKAHVTNGTGHDLSGCVIALANKAIHVGSLPSGEARTFDEAPVGRDDAMRDSIASVRRTSFLSTATQGLSHALGQDWQNLDSGVLIGWSESPAHELRVNSTPLRAVGLTLVVCRLPAIRGATTTLITTDLWSRSMAKPTYDQTAITAKGPIEDYDLTLGVNVPSSLETEFQPAVSLFGAEPKSLKVKCAARGSNTHWQVEILDPSTRKWQAVGKAFPGNGVEQVLDVPSPARYIAPVDNAFRIRLTGTCTAGWSSSGKIKLLDAELQLEPRDVMQTDER